MIRYCSNNSLPLHSAPTSTSLCQFILSQVTPTATVQYTVIQAATRSLYNNQSRL